MNTQDGQAFEFISPDESPSLLRLQGTMLVDTIESFLDVIDGAGILGFMTKLAQDRAKGLWLQCRIHSELFIDMLEEAGADAWALSADSMDLLHSLAGGGGPEWVQFALACNPKAIDDEILENVADDAQILLDALNQALDDFRLAA